MSVWRKETVIQERSFLINCTKDFITMGLNEDLAQGGLYMAL